MSLKKKIIFLICAIFCVYGLVGLAIQRHVILPSFVEMERRQAIENSERILEALNREVSLLIPSATDWGTWDDTYTYMADRNEAFFFSNLNAIALESLNVNYLGLYESDGRRVWGMAYNPATRRSPDLGDLSADALPAGNPLIGSAGAEDTLAGLYPTPQGAMMVASRPILPTSIEGESRGRIVMGRLLDEQALKRLAEQARVNVRHAVPDPWQEPGRQPRVRTGYLNHSPLELSVMPKTLVGGSTLYGLNNASVLHLEIDTHRTMFAQGKRTLNYALLYLISSGCIVLMLLLLLLRHTLFVPVARFIRHVTAVGTTGDLNARIAMDRKDEIGILADHFDRMVALLAQTRSELLRRSYRSGVAETASGVLHNIGNALTPLGVKVAKIKQILQRSPAVEIERAAAELSDPGTPSDRRADLSQFLQLAAGELTEVIKQVGNDIKAIQTRLDYINKILSDQQRQSRAERILEPLQPAQLIGETVQLLSEELLRDIRVVIEPGVNAAGAVRSAKVALQQVVSNLLINAAEAIRGNDHSRNDGRIRIRAVQDEGNGKSFSHLIFEDNGAGIAPEHLRHLFEQGFSTKTRRSGMGLHWSANTITALGGRLYAESAGPGHGATFHLLLPLEMKHAAQQPMIPDQEIAA